MTTEEGADPQEHRKGDGCTARRRARRGCADTGADEGEPDPADELAQARAEAEENWNKYLRIVAELENVRKRNARELEKARNFGVEGLAAELLTVADSLEMALATRGRRPCRKPVRRWS